MDDGSQPTSQPAKQSDKQAGDQVTSPHLALIPLVTVPTPRVITRDLQFVDAGQAAAEVHSATKVVHEVLRAPGAAGESGARVPAITPRSSEESTGLSREHGHTGVLIIEGEASGERNVPPKGVAGAVRGLVEALGERPFAPRPRPRRWLLSLIVSTLMALSLGIALFVETTPLGNMAATQVRDGDLDLALQTLSNPNSAHQPTGPWDTQADGITQLGQGGGAGPGVNAPGSAGLPVSTNTGSTTPAPGASPPSTPVATPPKTVSPTPTSTKGSGSDGTGGGTGIDPAPVSPWPPSWAYMSVPGHPSFAVKLPSDGYYWWAFGQCTWWAQYQRRDENLRRMGNARYWAAGARQRGYTVGSIPRKGATVVFQPGVEGAGGAGHVAHVVSVYPDGWFLVSEMNFYWNGGGWGRVSYRYAYARSGVSFIY